VPQPAPTNAAPAVSAGEQQSQQGATVPNLVGVGLASAEKELRLRGVSYRVLLAPGSVASGGWTVCHTNPLPGTHLESGTVLRLIVGRSCR
jgi:hypothetical protein